MRRESLRSEIVRLYEEEKMSVTKIAATVGCSKANVSLTIKRALGWNHMITPPLPQSVVDWIMQEAVNKDKAPAIVAREIILKAHGEREQA